ncbi:MAG TPA: Ku protein [Magnetospirillaceae bacterium]|jgi:DNA end-binding protein Ku
MAARRTAKKRSAPKREHKFAGSSGRPIWSGQLRLALVALPVRIYPATKSGARLNLHQVHAKSHKRIRYEKVVPGIGPVDIDEIVRGYEIGRGKYVLLTDAEIESVKVEASRVLDLVQFVEHCAIDPVWFDRPYYVLPDDDMAEEAYCVLRDAMRRTSRMGIGQLVMRGHEYLVALKPSGDGLMLDTLRYPDEIRAAAPFFSGIGDGKVRSDLLDMAKDLIERKSGRFDPKHFKDHYTEALRRLIDRKRKSRGPVTVEAEELPEDDNKIVDLVDALKRSVRGNRPANSNQRQSKAPSKARKRA